MGELDELERARLEAQKRLEAARVRLASTSGSRVGAARVEVLAAEDELDLATRTLEGARARRPREWQG